MELKGTNDWSDFDSKDSKGNKRSNEAPKESAAEALPERRAPVFDLGIIYDRKDLPPETLRPVSQERDHVEPEVAHGITLGTPESRGEARSVPSIAEQAHLESAKIEASLDRDNEDDDSESEKKPSSAIPSTQKAPAPVPDYEATTPYTPPIFEAPNPNPKPQPSSIQNPFETMAAAVPLQAAEASNPYAEQPITPEPAIERASVPPTPTSEFGPGAGGSNGGNVPPFPPEQFTPPSPAPGEYHSGEPNPILSQPVNRSYTINPDTITKRTFESAQADMRRKFAAKMILAVALTWYLARRPVKHLREQVATLQDADAQKSEQLSRMSFDQQAAQRRIAEQQRQIEQFTHPVAATSLPPEFASAPRALHPTEFAPRPLPEQQTPTGQPGEEVVLGPGQRYDMAGAYGAVFDENNNVVPGAIQYGQEYQRDRAHEQIPAALKTPRPHFSMSGSGSAAGFGSPMAGTSGAPILSSGQMTNDHMLPMNPVGQTPNQEAQHLLNAPKPHPVVSALTSPWLWLGVGVLLIAFFAAATI